MLDDEITLSEPFKELEKCLRPYVSGVYAELDSLKYSTRSHYSRATYMAGCRGPLCRTAAADWHQFRKAGGGGIVWPQDEDDLKPDTPERFNYHKYAFLLGLMRAEMRLYPDHLIYAARCYGVDVPEDQGFSPRPHDKVTHALKETLHIIENAAKPV